MTTRRVGWHRHTTGVQAAEEGRNEVESGWINQQHSLAGKAHVLQAGSDGAGPLFQLGVCQDSLIGLPIEQMNKCGLIRPFLSVAAQLLMTSALDRLTAVGLGIINQIAVVLTLAGGWLFFCEIITIRGAVGSLLTISGVLWSVLVEHASSE